MPGKVKVKISSGKNLPVMDRSSDTTDAYVEIKLGSTTFKTDVCRKSLHPQWNTDWYRFEVEDSELQDEPLQIRLMDHDTYSANDAIGKVYLNLNPLLLPVDGQIMKYGFNGDSSIHHEISGWLPVYDTMHGIRGEVNITVKVELFSDFNRFRQSSCGVQFFYSPTVPQGYQAKLIHGFVEELVVYDDPEYQWIDKIRTPRASNEARQTLFFKLSGELQRKIGVKTLNLGGNAVIGYKQSYDLEGESGIVARGIGTAITLTVSNTSSNGPILPGENKDEHVKDYLEFVGDGKSFRLSSTPNVLSFMLPAFSKVSKIANVTFPKYKRKSRKIDSFVDSGSIRASHSIEDISHSPMERLLQQENERGKTYGLPQKLKNFKYSQKSLSKKMTAFKSKLSGSVGEKIDEEPVVQKKYLHKRSDSDSSFMAEVLARSAIQVHNSLTCILEVKNQSTEEGKSNQKSDKFNKMMSDSNTVSDESASEGQGSYSDSTTSDEEDDSLNIKNSQKDLDTISTIVKDVEMLQIKQKPSLLKQRSLPAFEISRLDSVSSLSTAYTYRPVDTNWDLSDNENNEKECRNNSDSVIEETTSETVFPKEDCEKTTITDKNALFEIGEKETSVTDKDSDEQVVEVKNVKPAFKGIVPEAIKSVKIEERSLVRTAIQTLLLDKAQILGTYTPPITPSEVKDTEFPKAFLSGDTTQKSRMPKSASSVSFIEYVKKREHVLGVPFTDITATKVFKRRQSQPCLLKSDALIPKTNTKIYSDNQLNKPLVKTLLHESLNKKKLPAKLNISSDQKSTLSLNSGEIRRVSSDSSDKKSKPNLLFRIFSKKISRPAPTCSNTPTDSDLTSINISSNDSNTDIKNQSDICTSTKHACITPNRHNISPQADQIGSTYQQNLEQRKSDQSPSRLNILAQRRSSDSDLSTTPKGFNRKRNSLTSSEKSGGHPSSSFIRNNMVLRSQIHQENFDMLEYPFLTILKFPADFISHIGGAVSARSVKRLETIRNIEEPESRDTWWSEIRMEIRSHARSLNCNAVLGYYESSSICEDICILSAYGTAVVLNFHKSDDADEYASLLKQNITATPNETCSLSYEKNQYDRDKQKMENTHSNNKHSDSPDFSTNTGNSVCTITHLPYASSDIPVKATLGKCMICRKGKVPEVLIATIEPLDGIPSTGRGCFIESYVCRPLKDLKGEWSAKEISDGLPFLEYELHRLLVNKLKIKGMNAIFGLKFRITVGEKLIIATATGTAIFLTSLPSPTVPKLVSDENVDDPKIITLQKQLKETVKKNKEIYKIEDGIEGSRAWSDDDSDEEPTSLDLSSGSKDCCVLEVDDPKDEEVLCSLMKERPPDGFHVVNTETIPGLDDLEIVKNLQMFIQCRRFKFQSNLNIDEYFSKLLQSVYFKLRRMVPCALCNIQFRCDIPEPDEVQLLVFGMALGLGKKSKGFKSVIPRKEEEDMIFKLEEDSITENNTVQGNKINKVNKLRSSSKYKSSLKQRHTPQKEIHGVDITPLSYVPGASVDKYLGNINFFFIRETTSIREEGGLSGFLHSFVTEVLAIVRAHVTALGGNALVAFFLTELFLNHNFHKNQGQCLINVGGDVVSVTSYKEDT
ncbi:C2 domain-containing protein 5 isoform X2 [Diabrotica virgifera virgifera]|uniref:C2 domain-containing protein n=1 Tax=Diabrotica virgifera virgifera TaxID=50390 RepID=A0ABM5JGX9_DIAVI|nr:C2 domain-containing protein 5 isoform X1 [Diabrotica virgifera virgifera]XP_050497196.1 C2 domain-containing protein 5 isoform X2 [Diabrotica virgifera virgifera]